MHELGIQAVKKEGPDIAWEAASGHWKVTLAPLNSPNESSRIGADHESTVKFPQPQDFKSS